MVVVRARRYAKELTNKVRARVEGRGFIRVNLNGRSEVRQSGER